MKWIRFHIVAAAAMLMACQPVSDRGTIGRLRNQTIEIEDVKVEGGLEKAMQSYQRFLQETPDTKLAPEAIRRLADLKIEQEYGTITGGAQPVADKLAAPETAARATAAPAGPAAEPPAAGEADDAFERRATQSRPLPAAPAEALDLPPGTDELDRAGPREALALYQKLLDDYPLYDRNDQVLYQMSRAYEELGRNPEALAVMERLVREYPDSRYIDEVQFRRAEHFFSRRKYLDAEDAYKSIVDIGVGSSYYELTLYKLGWTFYKQELYEEAQHRFIALLDHKISIGYDFEQIADEAERKRTDDTFRVVSLSFSNLGGAGAVAEYFSRYGQRSYEDKVYGNLGEFYFDKRRYADASATYNAFVSRNPFHKKAPNFHMRVIEIHAAGGFPSLVLDAKKAFATNYGVKADYWKVHDPNARQDVMDNLKQNLTDLANHYHASYQHPRHKDKRADNFKEALHWYREFMVSFPKDKKSPGINYQLADLLLENKNFGDAAVEYEKTAYDYPSHTKASAAGYAAVYAHRKHLETTGPTQANPVKREVVRSSMKFVDTFPNHEKADIVLGAAAEDLYAMQAFEEALGAGRRLLNDYPKADTEVTRTAWLIVGHASYEIEKYPDAELAYLKVLELLPAGDKSRKGLMDNLAASIYKQGEQANAGKDYRAAADHFLRVGRVAPTSRIRATAEYDGAAALIQLKAWEAAASVLVGFRNLFPGHELQPEVTKKIAYVYKEDGKLSLAAREFERIETETRDDAVRRDALLVAADLYEKDGDKVRALAVYRRYVGYFPQPVDLQLETRNKIATILKAQNDVKTYHQELQQIVAIDAAAGKERTPRTRYLAGKGALVLAEVDYAEFEAVRLVKPFQRNLKKKQELMKKSIKAFNRLVDYELGEVTAAATYYLAEIYIHFSKALMASERPVLGFDVHRVQPGETLSGIAKTYEADVGRIARENNLNSAGTIVAGKKLKIPRGLSPMELEQYELALEEQAYPFEEKGIGVHESNLKLIGQGVYNEWIDKSLQKLAKFMPARYAKPETPGSIVTSLERFNFQVIRAAPVVPPAPDVPGAAEAEAAAGPAEPTAADDGSGASADACADPEGATEATQQ
ncbi:tetratricopeptide repeat protein [uncultured Desulfosarcina sp.]|uniref:tetratricopeptide repeat protein n=1 Tax=uncultured Desulfosarcina sp. TaxID=218289 RepID=UPI0029C7D65F|nr:tetratricopeptide repeat protein [uncultured Desulfosarcina sp.]